MHLYLFMKPPFALHGNGPLYADRRSRHAMLGAAGVHDLERRMTVEEESSNARLLHIPSEVPEDFAQAVATFLILGTASQDMWDRVFLESPEKSLGWIDGILRANLTFGLLHPDLRWWEHQVRGH
jgi:hypothetical protein